MPSISAAQMHFVFRCDTCKLRLLACFSPAEQVYSHRYTKTYLLVYKYILYNVEIHLTGLKLVFSQSTDNIFVIRDEQHLQILNINSTNPHSCNDLIHAYTSIITHDYTEGNFPSPQHMYYKKNKKQNKTSVVRHVRDII